GRGTRLDPEHGKEYFTILDFRNASRLFADPDFDGEPEGVIDIPPGDDIEPDPDLYDSTDESDGEQDGFDFGDTIDGGQDDFDSDNEGEGRQKFRVNDVTVTVLTERVQYYDKNGKLVTESLTDYTRKNILKEYASLESFLNRWNTEDKKQAIIDELTEAGVFLEAIRESEGLSDLDDFDLICHLAYDQPPLTKSERAKMLRNVVIFINIK